MKPIKIAKYIIDFMVKNNSSIEELLETDIRSVIDFDYETDAPSGGYGDANPYIVQVQDKYYQFWLDRGECLEATWDSKIFEWDAMDIKEIDYTPPVKKVKKKNQTFSRKQVAEIVDRVMFHMSDNGMEVPGEEYVNTYYPE